MDMETEMTSEEAEMETQSAGSDFSLYQVDNSEGQQCTLLQAHRTIQGAAGGPGNTFNILMADVSGSMSGSWPLVVKGWNDSIRDKLTDPAMLFVFNTQVTYLRKDTSLAQGDFLSGGTNITEALKRLRHEIDDCSPNFVNVFIITDGGHGSGAPYPEEEIQQMRPPPGKTVNVYLLGITNCFPVNYSIDIRSHLHNGSANMDSFYWARESHEIVEQIEAIGRNLAIGTVKVTLNQEGYILPGLESTSTLHAGEWMYFPEPPDRLPGLKAIIASEEKEIPHNIKKASVSILLDNVFPQWNSMLIKQHRQKKHVPKDTFNLMDSLFHSNMDKLKKTVDDQPNVGVKARLQRKSVRNFEREYTTLMNTSRTVIEVEGKYENEIELANNILKSTVSGMKYDTKNLRMRGHGLDDFERDVNAFRTIYEKSQGAIKALPPPHPDDCCRITVSSTLSDLQDEDFLLMLDEGKYELLRNFTMTGIPAYAPVRDSSQINAWTMTIRHMLVTPYTILSQRAIELKAEVSGPDNVLGFIDKDVQLKADDEKSRFNIIIPIVPASASKVLKTIVRSNLYAMMTTFCILKNPHIVDYNAHLAALAIAWVRSVADHPPGSRPEYVTDRLTAIVATAELYMDRKTVVTYLNGLEAKPQQALMTESTETFDEHTLKCESLVKPLFFLGLRKDKVTASQLQVFLKLLLFEYIGRCLSNYKTGEANATPFTDFFVVELNDPKKKEEWLMNSSQSIVDEFNSSHQDLLKDFFAPENVEKATQKFIHSKIAGLGDNLTTTLSLAINMDKTKRLRNPAGCGDVRFYTFRAWAQEMGVSEDDINAAYDPAQVLVYVCEALRFRNSRERLARDLSTHDECLEYIKGQVAKENGKTLEQLVVKKINETAMSRWMETYLTIHKPVVKPLSREQVIAEAQPRGIQVTEETFNQVYRYDPECQLVRNACQIPACPHYLVPTKRFNQHLAVERLSGIFPHALHLVAKELCGENEDKVVEEIVTGSHSGTRNRKKYPLTEPESLRKLDELKPQIAGLLQAYKEAPPR